MTDDSFKKIQKQHWYLYKTTKSHKTIVLKLEAEASGKRLHPCFVTCVWDIIGRGRVAPPPLICITAHFNVIQGGKKNKAKNKWYEGGGGGGGDLLCVHKIQKYPGVCSYQTYTTAQEPTKVQCTNKKK